MEGKGMERLAELRGCLPVEIVTPEPEIEVGKFLQGKSANGGDEHDSVKNAAETVDIGEGIKVIKNIALVNASGENRFLCPICSKEKRFWDWTCRTCGMLAHRPETLVAAVKWYIHQLQRSLPQKPERDMGVKRLSNPVTSPKLGNYVEPKVFEELLRVAAGILREKKNPSKEEIESQLEELYPDLKPGSVLGIVAEKAIRIFRGDEEKTQKHNLMWGQAMAAAQLWFEVPGREFDEREPEEVADEILHDENLKVEARRPMIIAAVNQVRHNLQPIWTKKLWENKVVGAVASYIIYPNEGRRPSDLATEIIEKFQLPNANKVHSMVTAAIFQRLTLLREERDKALTEKRKQLLRTGSEYFAVKKKKKERAR